MKRFDHLEFDSSESRRPTPAQEPQLQPDHDENHWFNQALEQRRCGMFDNALRYYSRALEINKALLPAWIGQVQMLIMLGEYTEAELWARKALELFRNNGDLLAARAHALIRLSNTGEALITSDGSLQREGQSAYRWMVRGEIMLVRREHTDQHCFEKAIQAESDWLVPLEIGQIIRHYRKPGRAMLFIRQAVERAPEQPYPWFVQGCCEMEMNLLQAAKRSFIRALELKPSYLEATRKLTEISAEQWSIRSRIKRFFGMK